MTTLEPVAPPPVRAPLLSLVSLARDPLALASGATERWEDGFAYLPLCGTAGAREPCGTSPLTPGSAPETVGFVPVDVWAASDCPTTTGRGTEELRAELRQRAVDALTLCESSQIEAELWSGAVAAAHNGATPGDVWPNRWLASDATIDLGSGDPVEALACLERSLAGCACGRRGMIHATADLLVWWDRYGLVRTEGAVVSTRNGTVVVPGAGYDGSGPDGPVGSGAWAYATGMVDVRRGPVLVTEGIDHRANSIVYRAVRRAAATWDGCCAFGVHVEFDSCAGGS